MKLVFTDKALAALKLPPGKAQLAVWDIKQKGLGYVLGATGGTYVANYHRGDKRVREALGRRGELSLPDARAAAKAVLGRVVEGKATPGDQRRTAKSGPTLADGISDYLEYMRNNGCRPSAIATVERELEHPTRSYLREWLTRPLRTITAKECRVRHVEISTKNGKHVANRVMRNLRSMWNHVSREQLVDDQTWPANPTLAVNWHSNGQVDFVERRREPVPWGKLPAWRAAVDKLAPVRRDYNLVVMLTGLRRTDACTLRWEHVNLTSNPIETPVWDISKQAFEPTELPPFPMLRPMPKGGAERAFVVPISVATVDVLERRRAENQLLQRDDGGWVFPSRSLKAKECSSCAELGLPAHVAGGVGHMTEPKEDSDDIPSPHRLRDTYITSTEEEEVDVPEGVAKVLVNHAWGSGDVTKGYRRQDLGLLRSCQERISKFLLKKMQPAAQPAPTAAQRLEAEPSCLIR